MWLDMYYIIAAMAKWGDNTENAGYSYYKQYRDMNGTLRDYVYSAESTRKCLNMPFYTTDMPSSNYLYLEVHIGTGTTAVTGSDHTLVNEIDSGVERIGSTSNSMETGVMTRKRTISNISTSDITIREIGLSGLINYNNSNAYATRVLIYREVLDEPIVLAPGESFTFALTDTFTIPA